MMAHHGSITRAPALLAILGIACVALLGSMPTASGAEKVTYLLPAPITLPAFGPWVVAQQRGYYAAEDLEVRFQTANGGADVAKQVGVGNAVIGGATGDTSIIVRGNGVPVKSVALLGGGGLTLLVVPEDSAIKGPADLKGKVITVSGYQQTTYYQTLGMLAKVGLSKSDVDIQAPGPAGVWKLFLARQADAMAGVPDFLAEAERNGMKVRVYPSQDYFRSMAQAILASDTTIAKRPELIRKLVRATLRGMKDIMDDPRAAAADHVKAVPQLSDQHSYVLRVFELYKQYVYGGAAKLGIMDEGLLTQVQDFYAAQGIVARKSPVKELYTNQFIE
jgi:NitT/TauT family transport system substrate-binding protein